LTARITEHTTNASPAHPVLVPGAPNLRDVGGHPTRDGGWVRTGLVYRSGALDRLTDDDRAILSELGVMTVFDLRTEHERTAAPDVLPPGTAHVAVDVLGVHVPAGPANLMRLAGEPEAARATLGDGRAAALWTGQYRDFVRVPAIRAGFGRLVREVADPARRPAIVHCTTGKDRTGWAAAVLLSLLGVADDVILEDYLRSGVALEPMVRPLLDQLEARGGDPELWRPILSVEPDYLRAALDEVRDRFGSIEAYVTHGLDVDAAAQASLREAFLAPG
jgi:protein-tyrosine phosphatase